MAPAGPDASILDVFKGASEHDDDGDGGGGQCVPVKTANGKPPPTPTPPERVSLPPPSPPTFLPLSIFCSPTSSRAVVFAIFVFAVVVFFFFFVVVVVGRVRGNGGGKKGWTYKTPIVIMGEGEGDMSMRPGEDRER